MGCTAVGPNYPAPPRRFVDPSPAPPRSLVPVAPRSLARERAALALSPASSGSTSFTVLHRIYPITIARHLPTVVPDPMPVLASTSLSPGEPQRPPAFPSGDLCRATQASPTRPLAVPSHLPRSRRMLFTSLFAFRTHRRTGISKPTGHHSSRAKADALNSRPSHQPTADLYTEDLTTCRTPDIAKVTAFHSSLSNLLSSPTLVRTRLLRSPATQIMCQSSVSGGAGVLPLPPCSCSASAVPAVTHRSPQNTRNSVFKPAQPYAAPCSNVPVLSCRTTARSQASRGVSLDASAPVRYAPETTGLPLLAQEEA
ncbi:hypothetical protein PHLGIDRAFT_123078 [Phlebiopsis gigantea 11061_1 CR5-6]|uniref:Uncharacterized protein n=1 Tax=Phlebiopsis gigantea (strain 11061_1 CR5-6) TaxID=745531 RepID=A0A0C3S2B3_PHLG1|nr:hypothetical protein PHLGIDRAFT_123078 [Phlebiopsis gigantea 11061_1 CR5-6]